MFKYILVPATGAETDAPVFATALAVARLSAGHLVFLHARFDARQALIALTSSSDMGGGTDYYDVIEALEQRGTERQKKAEQAVREFCAREQLVVPGEPSLNRPSAEWRIETGDEALCLRESGRAADLVVTGRVTDGEKVAMDVLETSLMETGRPVLIAPAAPPGQFPGTIAIAWKNRPEAARAVSAALPFIRAAARVVIFSVEEGIELGEQSCEQLRRALSWHNPAISVQRLEQDGRAPVETLLAAVSAAKADLLVMGGYGHSRVREVIFGGFTRHVLHDADLPVLMAH
jgi:nucleotide-binding universal stress UspA family protein